MTTNDMSKAVEIIGAAVGGGFCHGHTMLQRHYEDAGHDETVLRTWLAVDSEAVKARAEAAASMAL